MNVFRAVEAERFEVVPFQDVQRDQFGRPLAGGRILVNLVTAIVDGDRRLDLRGVIGKILVAEQSAVGLGEGREFARDVAFVKAVARRLQCGVTALRLILLFGLDQLLQGAGEVGIPENLAGLGRLGRWADRFLPSWGTCGFSRCWQWRGREPR